MNALAATLLAAATAAAPGHADTCRPLADGRTAALFAAVATVMAMHEELAAVDLQRAGAALQRLAPSLQICAHEELRLLQRLPQFFEEFLKSALGNSPRGDCVPDLGRMPIH